MKNQLHIYSALVVALFLMPTDVANAQARNTLGNNGQSFGGSGVGSGSFGSGLGGNTSGFSATSQTLGGQGLSAGGAGQTQGGGANFVGRDGVETQSFFNMLGQAQGNNQGGQNFNRQGNNRGNNQAAQAQQVEQRVRVTLHVGFKYRTPAPATQRANLQNRLGKTLTRRGIQSPQVLVNGRTITLRGTVSDAHQRTIIERLARLEPGVSKVHNELVIQDTTPEFLPFGEL